MEDHSLVPHIWLKREVIFEGDKIVMADVTSNVAHLGLDSAVEFLTSLKKFLNHNFLPGLLVVSRALMSFTTTL